MIAFIVSLLVTGIVLVKMLFSDLSGGNSVVDGVADGARQGREIHDAIQSALDGEYEEEEKVKKEKDIKFGSNNMGL